MKHIFTAKAGFTLAELMAVVAIIAILSAIALGSYRSVMERAIFNEGEQMVHALAAAADAYYDDNNRTYPTNLCQLDKKITGSTPAYTSCPFTSTATTNFTYSITTGTGTNYVEAASKTGNSYTLRAYMEADGLKKSDGKLKQTECLSNDDFCASVGYKNCDSSHVCKKH